MDICPSCKESMQADATVCPHCRRESLPSERQKKPRSKIKTIGGGCLLILIVLMVIAFVFAGKKQHQQRPQAPSTFEACVQNNVQIMRACDGSGVCASGDTGCRSRCARDHGLYPPMNCQQQFGMPE
jgi:predicted nucleic acid-binding Zn ribbon protein